MVFTPNVSKGGSLSDFTVGKQYSVKEIAAVLGGELQTYLPQKSGRIVAGRFNKQMNPEAPEKVYPARSPRVVEKADLFVEQRSPVPVFLKDKKSSAGFQYLGQYRATIFRKDSESIKAAEQRSGRNNLAGILELERVGD